MSRIGANSSKYDALGYNCWLGYHKLDNSRLIKEYVKWCKNIIRSEDSDVINTALDELKNGIHGLLDINPIISVEPVMKAYLSIGTFSENDTLDALLETEEKEETGEEGFIIKLAETDEESILIIAGKTEKGLLYGVFSFIRAIQTQNNLENIFGIEKPANQLRILNHWDNLDGSIERGYAGKSIFFNNNKVIRKSDRIRDYARLLASMGINGTVINNVNVLKFETRLITSAYLPDVARLADLFREYGIRLYLSINFASPMELGGLPTADPLDEGVREWWKKKIEEIYSYIPDFGGFLVKADSENRPGPFTYNRNHADGANMLAKALKGHSGIVIWRCFVYNCMQDWRDYSVDRAKAAYDNFMPLDGKFDENVLLQIKNGPMDFQVREPVSTLFGGLRETNQVMEFQITQEYTGQQKHLCWLVPMWKEILDFDTYAKGKNTFVKRIVNGSVFENKYSGIAGVANIGDEANWTGFQLAQANLYGFGRLAWNPDLTSEQITEEWVRRTYSNNSEVVNIISEMLLSSWKIYESYTSPLGIGWMVNPNHHFGPNVDGYEYDKWGTYHRADLRGIGVDRTSASGTGYAGQYNKEVEEGYQDAGTCPEELLLFFHHIPYNYKLKSGETLIQYIYNSHFKGVEQAIDLKNKWLSLKGMVGEELFNHVKGRLEGQIEYSKEWRDVINTYFFRKTGIDDEQGRKIY
ncbi:alpha-glucuronidase [Ruminiclostridium sufflavum DSM 19573]|uniref:Xylan alpha-1,2-glucuronidase n=1 Tax=Ruminiclostridium sufflavum DSM 19573 TaxID=1121337 RepID=A0A318Y2Z8_9FIRM|nr:alpha-glucuronidase family glycosyl hydrolase [Ruminiclostridium sufflavum]PYG85846.1 alpha-glucuronidase [Ruminiclostridium sufflavum DSM 19573]